MSKRPPAYRIAAIVGLTLGSLLFSLAVWLDNEYDNVSIDQFLYQMKTPAAGADMTLTFYAVAKVGSLCILLLTLGMVLYYFCAGCFEKYFPQNRRYQRFCKTAFCRFITKSALPISLTLTVLASCFFAVKLKIPDYVQAMTDKSDFIEAHYANPDEVKLTFPDQKRNLIYIFLESMESTFAAPVEGTAITDNFIPELTALANEHIHFSADESIGGAYSYAGTTWTAAAMVAHTAGVPIQVPLSANAYSEEGYMSGAVSIGELLAREGYNQMLLLGSDAEFAARDAYFTEHGGYTILDINALKAQGRLPEDYREWWGFEDEKLFAFAKEELTRLAAEDKPFNFTMLTADTHFPNGYTCTQCQTEYDEPYPNVLRCSSRQVTAFVDWIKAQPFYANTTVVIVGDHRTMDPDFFEGDAENVPRTVYNCILNAAVSPATERRAFGTFDLYPTTLAAMGVAIEDDRLGLGTNLFSAAPTLTETYGFEILDAELQKHSDFYREMILEMDNTIFTTTLFTNP